MIYCLQLVVGRLPGCDIVLNLPDISGQHCSLVFDDNKWFIKDIVSFIFALKFISNCWTISVVNISYFCNFF